MPIRRFDHRARFRAAYLNNAIDQVNLLNKTQFYFYGQEGGNIKLSGTIGYSLVYETGDWNSYCPPIPPMNAQLEVPNHFWVDRDAIPTWGSTHDDTVAAHNKALSISANAAAYEDDLEFNGWGGYDLSGVTAGDYLTGGGYDPPGQTTLNCDGGDFVRGHGGDKANDGATASVYPTDPSAGGSGNFLIVSYNSASFNAGPQAVGFMHLLQSLPPGATITRASIPVKVTNFNKWTQTITYTNPRYIEPVFVGGKWQGGMTIDVAEENTNDDHGSVTFVMMGRKKTGTYTNQNDRIRRRTAWDALASEIPADISTDFWSIIDLTESCNRFLTDLKTGPYFSFVLFPSAEGTPLPGSTSIASWLASLPQLPEYQIAHNPTWNDGAGEPTAKDHGHNWNDLNDFSRIQRTYQDLMYTPQLYSWGLSWGGLEFGEGIIEWQYPPSEAGYRVTYRNIVRGDNPIVV